MKQAKNPVKVNFDARKIMVSRSFAMRAASPNSKEYRMLTDIQTAYPNYIIEVRTIKKADNEHYKGLTYSYMEHYIRTHDNAESRMKEYEEMRLRAKCHSMKYGSVKSWFLSAYPQIDDFTPEDFKRECEQTAAANQFEIFSEGMTDAAA